ncbi:kinesin-associated protein 3 isoform X2 [Diorhabda carinulata]|uniref:kinesin-associated protein 3 isoform X2 n=1 Tax=Diorhabda sublineata TaxID=1163346 RepID=UPI0024E17B79|nr:kinesin-associated protein 3 isoform X2 [Diorhabda sublineata]XP_057651093.1 kinesin-associated protein 3 isoform X2 [Diorhabda carinulata]
MVIDILIYFNIFIVFLLITFRVVYCCIIYICKLIFEMEPEDAKFMRTERKPGSVDVHPNIDAICLNYDLDIQILASKENVIYGEKKSLKKIIELPMINSRTDCHALSKEVVNQCELIHHSRLPEVEQIIYYLKKRKLQNSGKGIGNLSDGDKIGFEKLSGGIQEANYNSLSEYIDLLYEGMAEKIKGAQLIQLLARDPENLEALATNETLISALGRVLREDWKRSIALSTHLVFTFFCFSMYSCFHEVILKCKVSSICMDIIDYELRRYDRWKADFEGSEAPSDIPIVRKPCPSSASMSEIPRSRIPEPVRPKSGNFSDSNISQIMEGSIYDDLTTSMEGIDDRKLTDEQKLKRFRTLVKKQEHLLRVAFYLLLNISEDEIVEEKMSKRNIVGLLAKALERENDDLLILVITFLKKLSIMQCNKEVMVGNLCVIDRLPRMLNSNSADLVHLTLKLLFNLSFDNRARYKIIKSGMLPKIMSLLSDDKHQEVVLKILYHLSYEDEVKHHFVDCIGLIIDMLLLNVGNENDKTMVALCINLATDQSNAQHIIKKNRLQALIMRSFTYQDAMLMKMLRNISDNAASAPPFIEFVGDIAKAVVESKNEDFIRECIGILSNLHLPDLDWAEIFKHFDMIKWVKNIITSNNSDAELVLHVIVLLGTASTDEGCSNLFCETDILPLLIDLLKTHQEDDEIVLQIVYVFLTALSHTSNIDYIVNKTEAPAYLIDLLQDNNKVIGKLCNTCLNIISDHDKIWADRIRIEKFRNHNQQWLAMVDSQQLETEEEEEEDELPPYLNTEYLSTAVVPPLSELHDNAETEIISDTDLDINYFNNQDKEIQDFDFEAM